MKVLLDANVLYAAAVSREGLCAAVLEQCLLRHELVLSEHVLAELSRHLTHKARMPGSELLALTNLLRTHALLVQPVVVPREACPDPDDLPVLGAALAGGVEQLVTGDRHLLQLGSYRGIAIVTPRAFHDLHR